MKKGINMNFSELVYDEENIKSFIEFLLNSYSYVFITYDCLFRKISYILFLTIKKNIYYLLISKKKNIL